MKIISREEADAHQRATIFGGAKGFFGGLAVALPGSYALYKRSPYYRTLPASVKTLGVVAIAVPAFVIAAERAGQKFEREQWTDLGKEEMDTVQAREQARWESLSIGQKVGDVAARHQYGIIFGGWGASMAGAFGWIMRDPYQTLPQKLVQARMWAQGLTIGILIAAGALTHAKRSTSQDFGVHKQLPDHSWRDILRAQEEEAQRERARTAS